MKRLLICLLLVGVVGCGESVQAQPKSRETKTAETSPPKEAANPWDTPTRLALFVAREIHPSRKARALSGVVFALANAGDIKQALEVAQQIESPRSKGSALGGIASALARAGEIKQALEVAQQIEDRISKMIALGDITGALVEAGEIKQALELAQKIENPYLKVNVLRDIASALANEGDKAQALAILKQALEVAQALAKCEGSLILHGLTSLSKKAAKALAKYGPGLYVSDYHLPKAVAKILRK